MTKNKLTQNLKRAAPAAVLALAAMAHGQAQQTPIPERMSIQPQVDLAGTGIATLDFGRNNLFGTGGLSSGSQINFSDSALSVGFSQRLYRGGIGSFTLGGIALDQSNSGNAFQLFLNQAFLDFQTQRFEAYLGRTDNPSAQLVQFPTLRGDDLVEFTYLDDPFSNGKDTEEHRYGNVAGVTLNHSLQQFVNVHAQHLIDSDGINGTDSSSLNSAGVNYQYMALPTDAQLARLVSCGAGYEHRAVPQAFGGSSEAVYAGGVLNLIPSLTHSVDLKLIDTLTFGNSTASFGTIGDTFRANANAVAASLRLLNSPFGMPGSSISLTAGYKTFEKVRGANEFGFELTGAKRLGEGFDAEAQVGYMHRSSAFAGVYGANRDGVIVQVGLSFSFDATINKTMGPRRSPLNTLYHHIAD
ncbi:MAG: hypothetical protein ACYC96_07055 [Fimbriimonadaceae bacterium]